LQVSRLGIGSSYGVSVQSVRKAFDRGVNYLYWGTYRRPMFGEAIRQLAQRHRDEIVVVVQSYARLGWALTRSVRWGLRRLRLDRADVLLLGMHDEPPSPRVMDAALALQETGRVRHLAISCHQRRTFQTYIADPRFDILHVRYNAAHTGAQEDVFAHLPEKGGPGIVTYTATRWGQICDPRRTPPGEPAPRSTDCYRFSLSDPHVDVCMCGPSTDWQMDEALAALERGPMDEEELAWMRRVGQHIYANQGPLDGLPLLRFHRSAVTRWT